LKWLISSGIVFFVKRSHILTGSFLLLLFAIGVILLPTWHKANLDAFSVMLTHGASNEPIKKNNESGNFAHRTQSGDMPDLPCGKHGLFIANASGYSHNWYVIHSWIYSPVERYRIPRLPCSASRSRPAVRTLLTKNRPRRSVNSSIPGVFVPCLKNH